MIKVDNQHIVKKVAKQTYHANQKRNLLTILAVILTTFLIVSVLGIGIAYWQMISERQIKMNGMDYDIQLSEPTEEQVEIARLMEQVKSAGVCVKCAIVDSANDKTLSKLQLYWVDDICWKEQCLPAFDTMAGDYPVEEDEIVLSTEALRDMGITSPKIGMDIAVTYFPLAGETSNEESCSYHFKLSGYYKDFTGNARGYVSEAFYKTTGAHQTDFTQGTLKLTLKNSLYSQKEILAMQKEFGLNHNQYLDADYDSVHDFINTIVVLVGLLILIFISGYLFIFNTLYISVSKDIRYYGQLKTLGMTSSQLKKVIYRQALWNACAGIPIGLTVGYLISVKLIPMVLQVKNPDLPQMTTFSYYPMLFCAAIFFASLAVWFSSIKPARIAGNISPIEAMRHIEGSRRQSRSENGLKSMAWKNIVRDRKKAVIVLGSFVISLSIFFIINVVVYENNSKNILNQIKTCDMRLVNQTVPENAAKVITEEAVEDITNMKGVAGTRSIYSTVINVPYQKQVFGNFYKELYQSRYSPGNYDEDITRYKNGEDQYGFFQSKLVGIDDIELEYLVKKAGLDIDMEKFHKGEIALTSNFISISPVDSVGQSVAFSLADSNNEHKAEIVGIVDNPTEFAAGYTPFIIVSENWYKSFVPEPLIELVYVDYEESFDAITEKKIKSIFSESKDISFDSILDRYKDMAGSEMQIRILGNGAGVILAFLAILNYVNMMAAGVQNRKNEFATLESLGMTKKQIRVVLIKEGFGYAVISFILSIGVGIPASYVVFESMNLYGIKYIIPVLPNVALYGSILLVCILVPPIVYHFFNKGTVLERLIIDEN
ncbi:MAG: ABC transporter permease [Lachnospiraceae bacterium]|nr:ABC transporter permease [Lachnospiraceae bacterium]